MTPETPWTHLNLTVEQSELVRGYVQTQMRLGYQARRFLLGLLYLVVTAWAMTLFLDTAELAAMRANGIESLLEVAFKWAATIGAVLAASGVAMSMWGMSAMRRRAVELPLSPGQLSEVRKIEQILTDMAIFGKVVGTVFGRCRALLERSQ